MISVHLMTTDPSIPDEDEKAPRQRERAAEVERAHNETRRIVEEATQVNRTLLAKLDELSEVLRGQISYPTGAIEERHDP